MANLRDGGQFIRFLNVSVVGTAADYLLALSLNAWLSFPDGLAATCGFLLGAMVNYCGHTIFSYRHTSYRSISVIGFLKYFSAIVVSLVVRLLVIAAAGYLLDLPFWLVLLLAIGASFVTSYVVSTLWVFRRPD